MCKNRSKEEKNNISGVNIRELRLKLRNEAAQGKVPQRALAERLQRAGLDLDKNMVQGIESGKRFVMDVELKIFVGVFGVTCDELLKERGMSP